MKIRISDNLAHTSAALGVYSKFSIRQAAVRYAVCAVANAFCAEVSVALLIVALVPLVAMLGG